MFSSYFDTKHFSQPPVLIYMISLHNNQILLVGKKLFRLNNLLTADTDFYLM